MKMKHRFEIKESVVSILSSFRQVTGNERGGVLTGSIISDDTYRVSNVSEPCLFLNASDRCSYIRDASKANKFIKEDFEKSEHTRVYSGEWHTHPEDEPTPSSVDLNSIKEIYQKSELVIDGVVLVIVGLKSNYYGFYNGVRIKRITVEIVQ